MVYIFLADGFEETEAIVTADLLVRGGHSVKLCAVTSNIMVCGAHGITVGCDLTIMDSDFSDARMIVLPGGMPGVKNLYACEKLRLLLTEADDIIIGAICAAPSILGKLGLLSGKRAVCFPGFESELAGAVLCDEQCVTDGRIVTSKAAGTVFEFASALLSVSVDKKTAEKVLKGVYYTTNG